jgi:hypothetical protein
MIRSGAVNEALYPFNQRVVEIDYVSPPKQKTAFLEVSVSVCNPCNSLYPYDPRNLSINDFLTTYLQTIDGTIIETIGGELMQPIGA